MMISKKNVVKVLSSIALGSMLSINLSTNTFAESSLVEEGEAVSVTYYVDGKSIEIPKEDITEFLDESTEYVLPHEQNVTEDATVEPVFSPFAYACIPGYEYDGRRLEAKFENKKSGDRFGNTTSRDIVRVSSIGTSATIFGGATSEGAFTWGPINAKVGFNINGSYTWNDSESLTITIPPNRMGWMDYGSYQEKWTGTYYYLTSSCSQTNKVGVTPKGPRYKMNIARESSLPSGI